MRSRASDIATCAVFTALALIVSYLEHMIPLPFAAPGVKLGLANVVIVAAMYLLGLKNALVINVVRVLLAGAMFTGLSAMMYALAGALTSFLVMSLVMRSHAFSIIGVSVAGALTHNAAQYTLAALIVHTAGLLSYLPVLMVSGVVTGIVVGTVAYEIVQRLSRYRSKA